MSNSMEYIRMVGETQAVRYNNLGIYPITAKVTDSIKVLLI